MEIALSCKLFPSALIAALTALALLGCGGTIGDSPTRDSNSGGAGVAQPTSGGTTTSVGTAAAGGALASGGCCASVVGCNMGDQQIGSQSACPAGHTCYKPGQICCNAPDVWCEVGTAGTGGAPNSMATGGRTSTGGTLATNGTGGQVTGGTGTGGCQSRTCADLGVQCGAAEDGCGNVLHCGTCPRPTCSSSATECQAGVCTACIESCRTCANSGYECGIHSDGLGGVIDCGNCVFPQTCGGGGVPGKCGTGADGGCVPYSCSTFGFVCGTADDGCGNTLQCGLCTPPQTCDGTGQCR